MFNLFKCKHSKIASKFIRTPRYDREALIEYSYCEICKKLLHCKVTLLPIFSYPKVQYKEPIPLPIKKIEVIKTELKQPMEPPVLKKKNTGRKPSASTVPNNIPLKDLIKSIYDKPRELEPTSTESHITQELDQTYEKFEDEPDEDMEIVRKETPEALNHRIKRIKRQEQRKG